MKIELIPPYEPTAEELHCWGMVRVFKMTRAELALAYPRVDRTGNKDCRTVEAGVVAPSKKAR